METDFLFPSFEPEPWLDFAVCRGTAQVRGDHDVFFTSSDNQNPQLIAEGKRMCANCPVSYECLEYSERIEAASGTFGGMAPHERRNLRNTHGSVTTPSGRLAHQRAISELRSIVNGNPDSAHKRRRRKRVRTSR